MYVLPIKVPIRKKSGDLLKAPRIYIKQIKPFIKSDQLGSLLDFICLHSIN